MKKLITKLAICLGILVGSLSLNLVSVQAEAVVNETCQTVYGVRNCEVSITPETAISINEIAAISAGMFIAGAGVIGYSRILKNQL